MFSLTRADTLHIGRASCAGAGFIHAAAIPSHLKEYWAFPVFFACAAVAQIMWAYLLPRRISPRVLLIGAAGNIAIVGIWVLSRTAGVPIGPDQEVEAVGVADVVATLLEVVVVGACISLARFVAVLPSLTKTQPTETAVVAMTLILGASMGGIYVALLHS